MKITHRGIAPSEKTYRCTCTTCKTGVEFRADDPEVEKLNHGGSVATIWWSCPVCQKTNSVAASNSVEDRQNSSEYASQWYDR